MDKELHIHLKPEAADVLAGFPFLPGQHIDREEENRVIVALGDRDDTTTGQEQFLDTHPDVAGYAVINDAPAPRWSECYLKDGWVCTTDVRGEFHLERADNPAKNQFGYELDETWAEIDDLGKNIFVDGAGNLYC